MILPFPARFVDHLESPRGAIFIQVAVLIFVLTGFSVFVVDYGVLWLSRVQAQNAADSGALAGATARAFDEPTVAGQYTSAAATQAASANMVYDQAASPSVDAASPCPGFAAGGASDSCVQVGVYRDNTNNSQSIKTLFAGIFGATEMKVAATATAQVRFGNSTPCLKPWVVPDRFSGPDWAANKPFSPANDSYSPPTAAGGTGWGRQDFGSTIVLGHIPTASNSAYLQIDANQDGGPESEFLTNITSCESLTYSISDFVNIYPGTNPNPAWQSAQDNSLQTVFNQDPSASSSGGGAIQNSCAPASCGCPTTCANGLSAFLSPRIITVALADPSDIAAKTNPVRIVNLLSMLLLAPDGTGDIKGVIVPTTGLQVNSEPSVWFGTGGNTGNAFISIPTLVR